MNTLRYAVAALALSVSALLPLPASAEPAATPPAARFYPFVGNWTGQGELRDGDQPAARLSLDYRCQKAAAGWAVRCSLTAKNEKMNLSESDLFGVDPVTGKGHWFAITNAGETHNHIADWTDAKTMTGYTSWTQDGKQMEEKVTFRFTRPRAFEFHSIVRADGVPVALFSGTMQR